MREETKEKIARAHRGTKASEETKAKMSKSHTGLRPTAETRAKLSQKAKERKIRERKMTVLEKCRAHTKAKKAVEVKLREDMLAFDLYTLSRMRSETKDPAELDTISALVVDVRKSEGFGRRRKLSHPRISDGYFPPRWTHKRKEMEARVKSIRGS